MRNRVASLDILKIVSIFFIVIHHYALWTKWNFPSGFSLDKLTVQTMLIGGKLGVNIFVMITGYFMIHSSVKLKSIVQIWLETTIISLIIYFFLVLNSHIKVNFEILTFIRRLFPIVFGQYWFVTSYCLLYLGIPFLNKLINSLSKRLLKYGIILGFLVLSIYPFIYYDKGLTFAFPIWFAFLYLIGASIKIFELELRKIPYRKLFVSLSCLFFVGIIINIILQILFSNTELKITQLLKFFGWSETIFYTKDSSPLLLIMAVLIFVIFLKADIKSRKAYSYLARASFGVYLMQSAPWFSVNYLWPVLVNASRLDNGLLILIYGFFCTALIMIAGIILYSLIYPVINFIHFLLNNKYNDLEKVFYKEKGEK